VVLPVVPMFPANAWGLPYTRLPHPLSCAIRRCVCRFSRVPCA
jgi:hypothetical protein